MINLENTKYIVKFSNNFKKSYKKIKKQGKDINKLRVIVEKLANKEELEPKYKNHNLVNDKYYTDFGFLYIDIMSKN